MSKTPHCNYDDSYSTCAKTFSTLRIFSDEFEPDEITRVLQIGPTDSFRKGDSHSGGRLRRKSNGWFYSTEMLCDSKDTRRHIDLILTELEGKVGAVEQIHHRGCKIDIMSYWVSTGQGGPWMMPPQMLKLGVLGIAVWWDVYFQDDDKTDKT